MPQQADSGQQGRFPPGAGELPGLAGGIGPTVQGPRSATGRPPSIAWITDDLVAYTRDVWGKHLGRPVPESEAIEMLINVKRLAEAMLNAVAPAEETRL